MCAPIAGQSELLFFITQPKSDPSRNTLIESFMTPAENPYFDTQYGQCTSINSSAEIRFDAQKLKLWFNRFRKKPLNNISSDIGEKKTPMRMLSHSDDLWRSIDATLLLERKPSTTMTRESQGTTTIAPAIKPRLSTGV